MKIVLILITTALLSVESGKPGSERRAGGNRQLTGRMNRNGPRGVGTWVLRERGSSSTASPGTETNHKGRTRSQRPQPLPLPPPPPSPGRNIFAGEDQFDFSGGPYWVHNLSDYTPSTPTPSPTCTCTTSTAPTAIDEFEYDPRYQAETIEEAILYFPDLTNPDEFAASIHPFDPIRQPSLGSKRPRNDTKCETDECRACSSRLLERIQERGLVSSTRSKNIAKVLGLDTRPVAGSTSNGGRNTKPRCNRYRFTKNIRKFTKEDHPVPTELRKWVEEGRNNFAQIQRRRQNHSGKRGTGTRRRPRNFATRNKRQTPSTADLGQSYELSCVERGDPETEDNDSWVVTCNMCWTWRQLPEEYSPRFINELKCGGEGNNKCLSGFGLCHQRTKNVQVKKGGQIVDVATNTCCDCKVESGSPLHGFIAQ